MPNALGQIPRIGSANAKTNRGDINFRIPRCGSVAEKPGRSNRNGIHAHRCSCICTWIPELGVDQKVLARSYVFGDHSSWLKSLRERSAMEFAKEVYFSRKIPRWILGSMPVHLHICRPPSLVDREIRRTYTCIIDSLPVLGMVQINNVG